MQKYIELFVRPRDSRNLDLFAHLTHAKQHAAHYGNSTPLALEDPTTTLELEDLLDQTEDSFLLRKRNGETRAKFSFIDLFAGIGGFRLAGENSGGICRFSSEKDKYARISYHHNFGVMPFGDINDFTTSEAALDLIPDHDILCGGFPCQAFSISGRQMGFADKRGILFHRIADILRHKIARQKPVKVVFLENVRNFGQHDHGRTYSKVESILNELGYFLASAVIDSGKAGSPTKRQRIYLVAIHESVPRATSENVLTFQKKLREIENPRDAASDKNTLSDEYICKLSKDEVELLRIDETYLSEDTPIELIRLKDDEQSPSADTIQIGAIQKGRQGERIYSRKCQAITFSAYGGGRAARTGAYYINGIVRRLHPTECAKIMGFTRSEKTMDICGVRKKGVSDWQLYKQFGNSVVVPVIEQIYKLILKEWDIDKTP